MEAVLIALAVVVGWCGFLALGLAVGRLMGWLE